jgi:hypothetical protein
LSGEDGGIVKLNTVSQADAVFSHGWRVWMFKTCAADAPSTLCPGNRLSAQCRPCRTHRGFCIHPLSLVPRSLWPAGENQIFYWAAGTLIWCYAGTALCWFGSIESRHRPGRRLSLA